MIRIFKMEMNDNNFGEEIGTIAVRKNLKDSTKTDKVIEWFEKTYNCKVTNRMIQGAYDFATGSYKGGYILFGNNLPFRKIGYQEV